jgi:hypothetical protein
MKKQEIEKRRKLEKIATLSKETKYEILREFKNFIFDLESYMHLEKVLKNLHSRMATDYERNAIPYQKFLDFKNRIIEIFYDLYIQNLSWEERHFAEVILNSENQNGYGSFLKDYCFIFYIKGELLERFSRCKRRKNVEIPFLWNFLNKIVGDAEFFDKVNFF